MRLRKIRIFDEEKEEEVKVEFLRSEKLTFLDTYTCFNKSHLPYTYLSLIKDILSGGTSIHGDIDVEFEVKSEKILKYSGSLNNGNFYSESVLLGDSLVYMVDPVNCTIYPGSALGDYCSLTGSSYFKMIYSEQNKLSVPIISHYSSLYQIDEFLSNIFKNKLILINTYTVLDRRNCMLSDKAIEVYKRLIPKLDLGIKEVVYDRHNGILSYIDSFGSYVSYNYMSTGVKILDAYLPSIINSVVKDQICIFKEDPMTCIHPTLIHALANLYSKFSRGQVIAPWDHNSEYMIEPYCRIKESNIFNLQSKEPECLVFD